MRASTVIELGELPPQDLTIAIEQDMAPPATPAVAAHWETMLADKPRLFNGPILSYLGSEGGSVRAARDSYQRLAAQQHDRAIVRPPVMQLSVTGLVIARDSVGTAHALVGRRSGSTRIYGAMWELGPSGGIDAPPLSQRSLDGFDVFRQLVVELREETGLPADPDPGPVVAITIDEEATSADLVMRVELVRPLEEIIAHTLPAGEHGWEYETTRWVPCDRFEEFASTEPCIPPTVALAGLVAQQGTK